MIDSLSFQLTYCIINYFSSIWYKSLGFNVLGTLGILLIAKRRGWIPAARPVVEHLLTQGMFLSPGLIAMALAEIGE